jgi:hypothetical protein
MALSQFSWQRADYIRINTENQGFRSALRGPSCGFVNDVLHIRKRQKGLLGRAPFEGTHGEAIVLGWLRSTLPLCRGVKIL